MKIPREAFHIMAACSDYEFRCIRMEGLQVGPRGVTATDGKILAHYAWETGVDRAIVVDPKPLKGLRKNPRMVELTPTEDGTLMLSGGEILRRLADQDKAFPPWEEIIDSAHKADSQGDVKTGDPGSPQMLNRRDLSLLERAISGLDAIGKGLRQADKIADSDDQVLTTWDNLDNGTSTVTLRGRLPATVTLPFPLPFDWPEPKTPSRSGQQQRRKGLATHLLLRCIRILQKARPKDAPRWWYDPGAAAGLGDLVPLAFRSGPLTIILAPAVF